MRITTTEQDKKLQELGIVEEELSLEDMLEMLPKDENVDWSLSFGLFNTETGEHIDEYCMSIEVYDEDYENSTFEDITGVDMFDVVFRTVCWFAERDLLEDELY